MTTKETNQLYDDLLQEVELTVESAAKHDKKQTLKHFYSARAYLEVLKKYGKFKFMAEFDLVHNLKAAAPRYGITPLEFLTFTNNTIDELTNAE